MDRSVILALVILILQPVLTSPASAADITACTKSQLLGFTPKPEEVKAHRQFPLLFISYPFGTKMQEWGIKLTLRIDQTGQVVCYQMNHALFGEDPLPLNDQRRAFVTSLKDWRYTPLTRAGQAIPVVVSEYINERETPDRHVPLPNAPLDKVQITLERQGCFGSCPGYTVHIYGDGRATYEGGGYVDVLGTHYYRIPPQDVAKLVESLRASDIWSLRRAYTAGITDNPTYILTINMDEQEHRLEDYVGQMAGMPSTVSDFEEEVDKTAHSDKWINLSQEAVEVLKAEHFAFKSQAGADLLARAISNEESHDNEAMLNLITLGAPIVGARRETGFVTKRDTLINDALENQRVVLIDPLIAKGALDTNGARDQHKIDAAFRAAILGGNLLLVQKIWQIRGDRPHPSLKYNDVSDDEKPIHKRVPVTLLLSHTRLDQGSWDGLQIAKWLIARGCDMKASKADGKTLLHIATESGDPEFVRYLLAQGFDPSTAGEYGLPALGSADTEDVAMILLEAGTRMSTMHDEGHEFYKYAEYNHWQRIVEWLNAHTR